jgi:hypothetical protein
MIGGNTAAWAVQGLGNASIMRPLLIRLRASPNVIAAGAQKIIRYAGTRTQPREKLLIAIGAGDR